MKSLFPEKYHSYIYYFSLIILVIGMPLSKFMMSISQLIMFGNWVLEGNLKNKFIQFLNNKPAVILSSLLILHFIGLIYTSNFADAFLDIKIKIPLFALPLIISTSPSLSEKIFNSILKLFIAAVIFGTIISTLILLDVIHRPIVDIRGISIFISHIRFALLICVAVFISGYFVYLSKGKYYKIMWAVIILWLITSLILMESLTGVIILSITLFVMMIYKISTAKKTMLKYGVLILIMVGIFFVCSSISKMINERNINIETVDYNKLDKYTSHGNLYAYSATTKLTENGHLIWIYFCESELIESWNKRSALKYTSKDNKGNPMSYTLVRFLTSKGLRKDADAVASLSDEEIKSIERGVPNVNYQSISNIKGRIYETMWEIDLYKNTGDANGHSLTQRFEYWKVALSIIKENILFGVGTGDVQNSFDKKYVQMKSKLAPEWRLHSHNQYLSIAVAFGLTGLAWFLITLFYPMVKLKLTFDYLYITFFIISLVSFFTEDTLETQAGVTFYGFLNSFLLFARQKRK